MKASVEPLIIGWKQRVNIMKLPAMSFGTMSRQGLAM